MTSAIPIHAYAIASTVRPLEVATCFRAERVRSTKSQALFRYGADGWAVVFDFGAIVFFGVDESERKHSIDAILTQVGPESRPPYVENFKVEVDKSHMAAVKFDRIVLPEFGENTVEIIATVVGQSVAMEYYEEDVLKVLGELDRIAGRLAHEGVLRGRAKALVQMIGRAMATRNRVVNTLALLDAPLLVWEHEELDGIHRSLRASFEIDDRYRSLDHKLRVIQENLEILVSLRQHRQSFTLEMIVLVLIAVEVVLFALEMLRSR